MNCHAIFTFSSHELASATDKRSRAGSWAVRTIPNKSIFSSPQLGAPARSDYLPFYVMSSRLADFLSLIPFRLVDLAPEVGPAPPFTRHRFINLSEDNRGQATSPPCGQERNFGCRSRGRRQSTSPSPTSRRSIRMDGANGCHSEGL